MIELLNKFYEYFIKNDFNDQVNINNGSEFYSFYKIIINEYDLSKDEEMKSGIQDFFDYFDRITPFGRRKGYFSNLSDYEKKIVGYRDWFKPSPYMVRNRGFVYSIKSAKKIFCKAYLSVKPEKYLNVIIKLQDFINELYINHSNEEIGQCKFRDFPSNDAIVMRFACEEHYNEFLQYLEQNKDIMESIDTPNPFIPQDDHGLSLVVDNGGSYNYFVTRMIWDYMFYCRKNNANISIEGIVEFINNYDCSNDKMLNSNDEETLSNYKAILTGKILGKSDTELLSIIFKSKVKTLKATKE